MTDKQGDILAALILFWIFYKAPLKWSNKKNSLLGKATTTKLEVPFLELK